MSEYGPAFAKCASCGCLMHAKALEAGKCKDVKWCAMAAARLRVHVNGVAK